MREIKYIVHHCTATSKDTSIKNILKYFRERMGWKNPGYHFIIDSNGKTEQVHPLDKIANGVRNYNSKSIHISYIGGRDEDDRSPEQKSAQIALTVALHAMFPDAEILGHRDFKGVTKSCPRFDVRKWWKSVSS